MARKTIRGTTLEVFDEGAGAAAVVLVHGSASDHRTWDLQRAALAERYRVVTYSRRYHRPNEPIPDGAEYEMSEHVADLCALIRSLDAGPVHLIGHSYGGFVSLLAAIAEPALVRTMVLEEPPVLPLVISIPPTGAELVRSLAKRPLMTLSVMRFVIGGLRPAMAAAERGDMDEAMRTFGRAVLGPRAQGRLSAERREQVRANAIRQEFLGNPLAPITSDQVREVAQPTLLVAGRRSRRLWRYLVGDLHKLLPRSELVAIPGASHNVHEDNPGSYNASVLAFLARHAANAGAPSRA